MNNTEHISNKLLLLNGALLVSVIAMVFVISNGVQKHQVAAAMESAQELKVDYFAGVSVEAKSVYVFDIAENKVLYEKNATLRLPLASLTKLMTALTAIELLPKDSRITIRKEFLEEEGDTGLLSGESWSLDDLLDFSLVVSSNDGVRSIASVVGAVNLQTDDFTLGRKEFIAKMNRTAKELDLKQMSFNNESGLDEGGVAGGYGSAVDVANLLRYILINEPEILEATKLEKTTLSSQSNSHAAKNTNESISEIPGLIASKTGYTQLAGGNLAIAFDTSIGRPVIVVVLGSTEEGRFKDVQNLVNASLKYISE